MGSTGFLACASGSAGVSPVRPAALSVGADPGRPRPESARACGKPSGEPGAALPCEASAEQGWLTLPRMMGAPRVWFNGAEADLSATLPLRELLPPHLPLPVSGSAGFLACAGSGDATLEIIVSCESALDHLVQDMHDMIRGFSGRPALLVPADAPGLTAATYEHNLVTVTSGDQTWTIQHDLMPATD